MESQQKHQRNLVSSIHPINYKDFSIAMLVCGIVSLPFTHFLTSNSFHVWQCLQKTFPVCNNVNCPQSLPISSLLGQLAYMPLLSSSSGKSCSLEFEMTIPLDWHARPFRTLPSKVDIFCRRLRVNISDRIENDLYFF